MGVSGDCATISISIRGFRRHKVLIAAYTLFSLAALYIARAYASDSQAGLSGSETAADSFAGIFSRRHQHGSPTPTPTSTPTPSLILSPSSFPNPYASLQAAINSVPAGSRIQLNAGTYRFPITGDTRLNLPSGDYLIGAGRFSGLPSSPPSAILEGSERLTGWSYDSTLQLYYLTVGSLKVYNSNNNGSSHITSNYPCETASRSAPIFGAQPPTGYSYPLWVNATPYSGNAEIIDSNGNVQEEITAGTSGSTAPRWATGAGQTTRDGTVTWTMQSTPGLPCGFPQDLWDNDVYVNRTLAWPMSTAEHFYYVDGAENKGRHGAWTIYLNYNPGSDDMEWSIANRAIYEQNNNVTIENLTMKYFATSIETATLEFDGTGNRAISNWVTHNHAEGIDSYSGGILEDNEAIENGEIGIGTINGWVTSLTVIGNDSRRNGLADVYPGFEAGGSKFVGAGEIIKNNTWAGNTGPGLWEDECGGTSGSHNSFEGNTAEYNVGDGIRYEISSYGDIEGNTTLNNSEVDAQQCVANHVPRYLFGQDVCTGPQRISYSGGYECIGDGQAAEIVSAQSANVNILGNQMTSRCTGLAVTPSARSGACGSVSGNYPRPTGVVVKSNTVTLHTGSSALSNGMGYGGPSSGVRGTFPGTGNIFDNNSYIWDTSTAAATAAWGWPPISNVEKFSNWQANGQDVHGSSSP